MRAGDPEGRVDIVINRAAQAVNRALSADEVRAYVEQLITAAERDGVLDLVRWFTRRYRTPAERLAYARRASAR